MPHSDRLSTGQAATILAVTADTVLKWIKRGRLPATRTAGGHFRVRFADVQRLRSRGDASATLGTPLEGPVFCWQFHAGESEPADSCVSCIVYRARALRCFELSRVAAAGGHVDSHAGTHCSTSCLDCAYYLAHFHEQIRVVVALEDAVQQASLEHADADASGASLLLSFASSAYDTALAIQEGQPAFVVLHGSLHGKQGRELRHDIERDPRHPGIRVLVAGEAEAGAGAAPDLPLRFTLAELQGAIWASLRGQAATRS